MSKVIAVEVTALSEETKAALDSARNGLIKTAVRTGEVIKTYAKTLCTAFNITSATTGTVTTPWFDLKGKDARPVKEERARFVEGMTAVGYTKSTIDVYWQRIKEASGYVTAGNRVKGSESTDDKTMSDLKTILNRIFKAEEGGEEPKASEYKAVLMDVYSALGGDIDKLG